MYIYMYIYICVRVCVCVHEARLRSRLALAEECECLEGHPRVLPNSLLSEFAIEVHVDAVVLPWIDSHCDAASGVGRGGTRCTI